jgi:hypothetical protein
MKRRTILATAAAVAVALGVAAPAAAAVYFFNFNNATLDAAINGSVTTDGLSGAGGTSAINTYMQGILPGVTESGGIVTRGYTADGFAIPNVTLSNSDGATGYSSPTHGVQTPPDDFLVNNNFPVLSGESQSNSITIVIPAGVAIDSISFDYAIYPNGNCNPCSSSNSNFPSLVVQIGTTGNHTAYDNTTINALTTSVLDGLVTPFPSGGWDPQAIGFLQFTGLGITGASATVLTLIDWPPEIGMDNLCFNCTLKQTAPEPSPLPLAGLALALLAVFRRKARRGAGPLSSH